MKTLGEVVASQSANSLTAATESEVLPAHERVPLNGVAVFARGGERRFLGRRIHRALGDGANPRPEVRAVAERVQLDAEDRAWRKCGGGDALLRDGRRAGHLDAPFDVLA